MKEAPDKAGIGDGAPVPHAVDEQAAAYRPLVFDPSTEADRRKLDALCQGDPGVVAKDGLFEQVRELIKVRSPGWRPRPGELDASVEAFLAERGNEDYGRWIYYPWRRELLRLLAPGEFVELRTERNRYRITPRERAQLEERTVGIVGLSAGHSIALCMALERIGSRFRLADFDRFELANMNRVPCGVGALGLNKAVVAARQIYEVDPYLEVTVFAEGITPDNLGVFLEGGAKLDVLIEECDDLYMKVRLREEARARRIPVVMETNDRGLIDVERFDLDPERPVFHGLLQGIRSDDLMGLDTERKVPYLLRLLGTDMSPRLAASLIEIDKTISGWPQLASGNQLGGALVADTTRRIFLGQFATSGRFRVDLEDLISGSGIDTIDVEPESTSMRNAPREPIEPPGVRRELRAPSAEEVAWLVSRMVMAPSGGNDQPWRFRWQGGTTVDGYLDRRRSGSFLDYQRLASHLALGAAAENAVLAASRLGRGAEVAFFPESKDPDLVFRVALSEASSTRTPDPLARLIEARTTNRRLSARSLLDEAHARALEEAAAERGCKLDWVRESSGLDEGGSLLGAVDRFRFLCEPLWTAMMSELRFNPERVTGTRDGIDVATLELDAVGLAGLKLLSNPRTSQFLRSLGHGLGLEKSARRSVASASALGLISTRGEGPAAYVAAGRALQRVWLRATDIGLAFQPMSVAVYLFLRWRDGGEGFTHQEKAVLSELHRRFSAIFLETPGYSPALLFRVSQAPPPSHRALRRPIESVLGRD